MAKGFISKKVYEKFYCACGKECKPVKYAKTKWSEFSGMVWQCEDGHTERQYARKEQV